MSPFLIFFDVELIVSFNRFFDKAFFAKKKRIVTVFQLRSRFLITIIFLELHSTLLSPGLVSFFYYLYFINRVEARLGKSEYLKKNPILTPNRE